VFTNHSKEEEIFPLTTPEIAEAQKADVKLKHCFRHNTVGLEVRLIDDTYVVCKNGRMIIPKPLQMGSVLWYHHFLQHPGHTRLEETMEATIYWKGMRTTIRHEQIHAEHAKSIRNRSLSMGTCHLRPL
jgi:hypothetical protein